MENYFTYILNLINYISEKENQILKLNQELKKVRTDKNTYLDLISSQNAKISELSLYEEEREEELKYTILPIALIFIFIVINIFLFISKVYNFKILLLIIPIILSFPICSILFKKAKEKYATLRIKRKDIIEAEERKRKKLVEKSKELNTKEQELIEQITELEKDIKDKKEYKERIEKELITSLAPILDRLINNEIASNHNPELEEILKKIREI